MTTDYSDRVGDFTMTISGRRFYPYDFRESDYLASDAAHHLSMITRFGGATYMPLPVAQHAVYVACIVEALNESTPDDVLQALHHDDSEAYLCDMPRPIKHSPELHEYRSLHARTQRTIFRALGVSEQLSNAARYADDVMLHFEAERLNSKIADVMRDKKPETYDFVPHVLKDWQVWPWHVAHAMFTEMHERLMSQR